MGETELKPLKKRDFLSFLQEIVTYLWNIFFLKNRYKEYNITLQIKYSNTKVSYNHRHNGDSF